MTEQAAADPPSYFNCHLQDDAHLVALGRAPDGALCRRCMPAEWVAYYDAAELGEDLLRMLKATRFVRSIKLEGRWVRVGFQDRAARDLLVRDEGSPVRQAGVQSYEGDVHPAARWAADEGARVAKPLRAYVDIETDSRVSFADAVEGGARVLCVSVVNDAGHRLRMLLAEEIDEAEAQLLGWMWKVLEQYDQVVSWNGDGFDFPILWARSRARRLGVDANRWLWLDHMAAFDRLNTAAESGEEKRSLALENIGHAITGKGKLKAPAWAEGVVAGRSMGAATYDLWKAGGRHRELLAEYCEEDTDLMRAIEKETGYLDLFQTICEACSVFGNTRSLNPTVQMDGFMLKLGVTRGQHFATKEHREAGQKFKGAYVMKPHSHGIETGVHVSDFKSLYPSIILSFNMSPETRRPDVPVNGPIPEGIARTPTGVAFSTEEEGILVVALRELLRLRDHWKKVKASCSPGTPEWHSANRMTTTYKVLANSFYGVLSSVWSRFCDVAIGEAITQTAAWLVKQVFTAAEERGWRPLYGDTDSVYVQGCTEEEFRAFVAWSNVGLFPALMAKQGCKENHIKNAYEKEYERLVFCGAKNYIASYAHSDGVRATEKSKPEIKGLGYVRGDVIRLAAEMQGEAIDMIVGRLGVAKDGPVPTTDLRRYRAMIERWKARVLEGPLSVDDVQKSQALTKPLKDYVSKTKNDGTPASQPPHVQVAKILKERGREVREGTRIAYVVADGSKSPARVIPAEDYTGTEADRFYVWEHWVYPFTQALLEAAFPVADRRGVPNVEHDWARWAKVRPREGRGSGRGLFGQGGLFGDALVSMRIGPGTRVEADVGPASGGQGDTRVSPLAAGPEFARYAFDVSGRDLEDPTEITDPLAVLGEREPERELHVVFVRGGDDADMLDLERAIRARPGDDPLAVVVWEALDGGKVALGQFHYRVSFDALAGDHHLRALLSRLGAHFAA